VRDGEGRVLNEASSPRVCLCAHRCTGSGTTRSSFLHAHSHRRFELAADGETQSKSAISNQASVRHNSNNNKKRITCSLFSHLRAAVNASKQFKYADNASLNLSRCAHESESPPPPQNRKEGERRGRKGVRCREKHTGMAKVGRKWASEGMWARVLGSARCMRVPPCASAAGAQKTCIRGSQYNPGAHSAAPPACQDPPFSPPPCPGLWPFSLFRSPCSASLPSTWLRVRETVPHTPSHGGQDINRRTRP
jgi:hypothetical protein